ncbi:glycoside hydrolase family 88 protein [Paenibacillus sp. UNC451MF]|uniref:glycoside hydrolase family 88 protein n=1 Tax=Paenibacillus sp. UNC451MF TaxID=1449063 RepID=UPI00048CA413|nr:glycoside hydrolase family 88 protein [Paenibacillus sp. UNC451MF]
MVVQILSVVLLSLIAVIILIDVIPMFKDWVSRIHIGRYQDKQMWNKSITTRGIRWLNNTPKIKVTDNTRFVAIDMLRGNYTKSAIQHWQEAALVMGLAEYLKQNDDSEVKQEMTKFLNSKLDSSGQWIEKPKQVDGAILAYAIMKLDFIDTDRYKAAFDYIWDMIQDHRGQDGTVAYRKFMQNYRYVDTIGFICPFLVSYGIRYQNQESVNLAVEQIKAYEDNGMLDPHFIPSHAYQVENKVPLGLYGWGRGLGWYAIGLIDAWNELPEGHPHKAALEASVKKFAIAAKSFQQPSGNWSWTVTRGECRPDSSTTATLGWFMLQAAKIEEISELCANSADLAVHYLMQATRRNGAVDFSQGDTKDIGVYSMLFNILPFTQGFCIRLMNSKTYSKAV